MRGGCRCRRGGERPARPAPAHREGRGASARPSPACEITATCASKPKRGRPVVRLPAQGCARVRRSDRSSNPSGAALWSCRSTATRPQPPSRARSTRIQPRIWKRSSIPRASGRVAIPDVDQEPRRAPRVPPQHRPAACDRLPRDHDHRPRPLPATSSRTRPSRRIARPRRVVPKLADVASSPRRHTAVRLELHDTTSER